jgi:hypothetical protein
VDANFFGEVVILDGDGTLFSATPVANGVLPGLIDIDALPDGPATICVAPELDPGVLYGSSRDGELFTVDVTTGAGTLVGILPIFATEIEHDSESGRSFAQAPDGGFYGHEFDITDGSGIGGQIGNGGSFTGLEYVGSTLYGTVILGSGAPSELRILSPFTGVSSSIGPTGRGPISGLAYDPLSGVMYGIEGGGAPADLLTIDLSTGLATVVGSTGIQAGSLQFGPDGGLYAGSTGSSGGDIYRIDPASGAATFVGSTGFDRVTGLTLVQGGTMNCATFDKQGEEDLAINGAPCGPPSADAGTDATAECSSASGAAVTLAGSGSSDPNSTPGTNDDIVLFEWFDDFGMTSQTLLGTGETLVVTLPLGSHTITLQVTDSFGETDTDEVILIIEDTTPPLITVGVTPDTLWPPNHMMVDITAMVVVTDACGTPSVALTSATSNEADNGVEDGNTINDIQDVELGTPDFNFKLRAERAGGGNGRTYTAIYTATDAAGNAGSAAGFADVPHDQDGITDPLEVFLEENGGGTLAWWNEAPGAQSYDVIRGQLSNIVGTDTVISLGPVTCIEPNSTDESTAGWEDSALPNPGQAFFYLVEYDDGTSSSYGTESADMPRAPGPGDCE